MRLCSVSAMPIAEMANSAVCSAEFVNGLPKGQGLPAILMDNFVDLDTHALTVSAEA